ncbi:MAG: potassium channel protein [Deltaproteobacteria bacterium]|nr:potassium channel protein [Deltaproteobacteria bacterium]
MILRNGTHKGMPVRLDAALAAEDRGSAARVSRAVALLAILTVVGTLGFAWIEDLALVDALYMAVITLSTVGYQDVAPVTAAGRIYTVVFIMVGVGVAFYTVVAVAEFMLEGRLRHLMGRRNMHRSIESLRDHVIVCGFGRLGRSVVDALEEAGSAVVVIEAEADLESQLVQSGRLCVTGSALDDSVLRAAGIERARSVVIATPSDADNVFIALSARELNPDVAIHARAETDAGSRRLRLAGAEQVIGVRAIAGQRIANAIVRPAVVDFLELSRVGGEAPIDLEEVRVGAGCALCDWTLADLVGRGVHVNVVAVRRDGKTQLSPAESETLRAGDRIVVVGDKENPGRLATLAQGSKAAEAST